MGCYFDDSANQNLETDLGILPRDKMPYSCVSACAELQLSYAGVTDGEHCHCGEDRPADKQIQAPTGATCDIVCDGDHNMKCGGVSVYQTVYRSRNKS